MSKMIPYIFDNVFPLKILKSVREFSQKDTKNDPRAHDSKLTRRVKYAHAAELLSELEKRALRVIYTKITKTLIQTERQETNT